MGTWQKWSHKQVCFCILHILYHKIYTLVLCNYIIYRICLYLHLSLFLDTGYKRDGVLDVPLTVSGNSVIITCQITMGPTRSPFIVLLDTGSSLLALPTPGLFGY
jgi:hypothetical protein